MLATQMGWTQPPASVKGLRHASRQTVRLTIKVTGHSSTDPPSSISRTVTPTHVGGPQVSPQTDHAPRQLRCLHRSGLLRMCFKAALHDRQAALTDPPFPGG